MTAGKITIEVSIPADAEAVTALLEASYPALLAGDYPADLLAAALPLMTKANPALLRSGTYFLARDRSGLVVGCGGWTPERPGNGEIKSGLGHIRHFGTHPDHLRRGIGARLIERCIAEAASRGIHALECYATRSAVGFYVAAGFVTIGELNVMFPAHGPFPGVSFPSVLMRRGSEL